MSVEWFFENRGKAFGPFTSDQLQDLVQKGKVTEESKLRKGRDGEWVSASRVRKLFEPEPQPPAEDSPPLILEPDAGPVDSTSESKSVPPPVLPTTTLPGEQVIFDEWGILLTDRRIRFEDSACYALAQTVSMRRGTSPRSPVWPAYLAILVGTVLLLMILMAAKFQPASILLTPFGWLGIGSVVGGVISLGRRKQGPWILLAFSSGEIREIRHTDSAYLGRVWAALLRVFPSVPS